MENFKLTKSCIFVIVAALLAVLMLICPFFWGSTTLEYMEELDFRGLLFWIFYVTFAGTVIFSIIQKQDFAKLMSIVNLAIILLNAVYIVIDYGDGDFFSRMGIALYGCILASMVAFLAQKNNKTT